jgi:phthalate 4,5-cis-dihydrodiol dehydrogenase
MTISIEEATDMIDAADRNSVHLAVNVKHSFERRVLRLREMVANEEYGKFRMMHYWFYNDWLYRPRTPEELTPEWGGGVPWRQGPHQIDIMRTIGGGLVRSVRGMAGTWDPARRVPGVHATFFDFDDGAVATAVYSGMDHMSSGMITRGQLSERGPVVNPERYAQARKEFGGDAEAEAAAAAAERYGGDRRRQAADAPAQQPRQNAGGGGGGWMSGGPFVLSFDHADVWVQGDGLLVCSDEKQEEIKLPNVYGDGRWGRVNTFYESLIKDEAPPADGRWGRATIEVILSIFESSEKRGEVYLKHQSPTADAGLVPAHQSS